MHANAPHVVLFSESTRRVSRDRTPIADGESRPPTKYWHFSLKAQDGSRILDISDEEAEASDERLELLAVVRGLEALDQPSRVTLVTTSGSIRRGLRFGLDAWRENQWQWEHFGKMTPIKNGDLWRRVDRALQYHDVDCRTIRFDRPADDLACPAPKSPILRRDPSGSIAVDRSARHGARFAPQFAGQSVFRPWTKLAGVLFRLFGWCGLCRTDATLVITAH